MTRKIFLLLSALSVATVAISGCVGPDPAWRDQQARYAQEQATERQRLQQISSELSQASQQVNADLDSFYARGMSSVGAAQRAHSTYEQEKQQCERTSGQADTCWRKLQAFNQIELTWMDQHQREGQPLYGFATCTLQGGCSDRRVVPAIFQSPETCSKLNIGGMEISESTYCFVRMGPSRPWTIISRQRGQLVRIPAQWGVDSVPAQ